MTDVKIPNRRLDPSYDCVSCAMMTRHKGTNMALDRRNFAKSLSGVVGAMLAGTPARASGQAPSAAGAARAIGRLASAKVTRIRLFYPPNYDRNGPQAFPQSNMVVLVDTDAGFTGVGQGGSPDTVRNVARSVIGRNAFDTGSTRTYAHTAMHIDVAEVVNRKSVGRI